MPFSPRKFIRSISLTIWSRIENDSQRPRHDKAQFTSQQTGSTWRPRRSARAAERGVEFDQFSYQDGEIGVPAYERGLMRDLSVEEWEVSRSFIVVPIHYIIFVPPPFPFLFVGDEIEVKKGLALAGQCLSSVSFHECRPSQRCESNIENTVAVPQWECNPWDLPPVPTYCTGAWLLFSHTL